MAGPSRQAFSAGLPLAQLWVERLRSLATTRHLQPMFTTRSLYMPRRQGSAIGHAVSRNGMAIAVYGCVHACRFVISTLVGF